MVMNLFRRILVVIDPHNSQSQALRRAANLAARIGSHLKVIDVVERPPAFLLPVTDSIKKLHEQEFTIRQRQLDSMVRPYREAGIKISSEMLKGKSAIQTIHQVVNGRFDVVFKDVATSQKTGSVFSTVDKRLLRQCPCSLWLVRDVGSATCAHVAAAIDPQPASEHEHHLNLRIAQLASSIAKGEQGKLTIISTWRGSSELAMTHCYAEALVEFEARFKYDALRTITETTRKANLDSNDFSLVLRRGDPGSAITHEVNNLAVDLLIIGTLARGGIAGLFIGNTAERVLGSVSSSVLMVRSHCIPAPAESTKVLAAALDYF